MNKAMNDIRVNLSYLRLRTLIQARYGLRTLFEPLCDLKSLAKQAEQDSHLYIPIFHEEHHLATLRIIEGADILDEHKEEILVLSETVLRPPLIQWFSRQTQPEQPSFHSSPQLKIVKDLRRNRLPTNFVFVVSNNPARIRQFASEVYESSGGWALIQWQDIAGQTHTPKDLENLEGVTVFVPDILDLSPTEREIVKEFLEKNNQVMDNPLIIIGSNRFSDDFTDDFELGEGFTERLKSACLYLDQIPQPQKNAVEVLKLMFDNSSSLGLIN